jgi:hypothetical protein
MRNVGSAMEKIIDTMSTECSNNRETVLLCVVFNNFAKVTVSHTRFSYDGGFSLKLLCPTKAFLFFQSTSFPPTHINGLLQTFSSSVNEFSTLLIDVTHQIRCIQISMVSVIKARDIKVDDIAFFQRSLIRNTMADDFIHRCTAGLGEIVIVQGRWICSALDSCFVDNSV